MHGSMRRGLETERPAMVTAVKRPAGETRGKVAAGPDAGQRHRASPRPHIRFGFVKLQDVDGFGELAGAPGAAAEFAG